MKRKKISIKEALNNFVLIQVFKRLIEVWRLDLDSSL